MKNFVLGTIAAVVLATAIGAYSADEQKSGSPMGGMMHGMKGMMGEQKSGEQSHNMMQGMTEMMARMSKMMDMCSQMMASKSDQKKDEPSK
jgi:Spy/CpxP family protein refolding chaperone